MANVREKAHGQRRGCARATRPTCSDNDFPAANFQGTRAYLLSTKTLTNVLSSGNNPGVDPTWPCPLEVGTRETICVQGGRCRGTSAECLHTATDLRAFSEMMRFGSFSCHPSRTISCHFLLDLAPVSILLVCLLETRSEFTRIGHESECCERFAVHENVRLLLHSFTAADSPTHLLPPGRWRSSLGSRGSFTSCL